ncbi:Drebrin-like protein (Actin binding protein 1) [Durusdinium trenchii]|uniref:Drebrin-like protein (Actin binding protein 1) n=1 Tax=Durusdinium trenchii TaxID=1381693 RepID=A0ABP0MA65_9DINO
MRAAGARWTQVLRELGEVNASLQAECWGLPPEWRGAVEHVTCSKELTIDHLCEAVAVAEDVHIAVIDTWVELSQKRAHEPLRAPSIDTPERRPARRSGATARPVRRSACEAARPAEPQREEREISLDQALQEVAQEGFYDWLLLEPGRFCLFAAGSGGFEELQANLSHDRVLFGLLRLSFGVPPGDGRARGLTKHVLIHWVGPGVGAVRRGLWGAKYGEVSALMSSYCSVAFRQEANHANELKLDEIILKLQPICSHWDWTW